MKYQLVIQKDAISINDYDSIIAFEDELIELLEGDAEVDGHDFGAKEANIFIMTDNPTANFEKIIEGIGQRLEKENVRIAFRNLETETYTILYPEFLEMFEIK